MGISSQVGRCQVGVVLRMGIPSIYNMITKYGNPLHKGPYEIGCGGPMEFNSDKLRHTPDRDFPRRGARSSVVCTVKLSVKEGGTRLPDKNHSPERRGLGHRTA